MSKEYGETWIRRNPEQGKGSTEMKKMTLILMAAVMMLSLMAPAVAGADESLPGGVGEWILIAPAGYDVYSGPVGIVANQYATNGNTDNLPPGIEKYQYFAFEAVDPVITGRIDTRTFQLDLLEDMVWPHPGVFTYTVGFWSKGGLNYVGGLAPTYMMDVYVKDVDGVPTLDAVVSYLTAYDEETDTLIRGDKHDITHTTVLSWQPGEVFSVTNTVQGDYADSAMMFDYTLDLDFWPYEEVEGEDINLIITDDQGEVVDIFDLVRYLPITKGTTITGMLIEFSLAHGWTATLDGPYMGTLAKVTQNDYAAEGYETQVDGISGLISEQIMLMDELVTVNFVNTHTVQIPAGAFVTAVPWAVAIALILAVVYVVSRRRDTSWTA